MHTASPGYEPLTVSAYDDAGALCGLLSAVIHCQGAGLMKILSARSVIMGGPLVRPGADAPAIADALLKEYNRQIRGRAIYSEFRNLADMSLFDEVFRRHGYEWEDHLDYHIDLTQSEEELWNRVQSRRRNEIRKAIREGVTVHTPGDGGPAFDPYPPIAEVYRRIRLPLPGPEYFRKAEELLSPAGHWRPFGAFYNGRLIGTMLALCCRDTIYNWYAGSHQEFYDKNPNDLIPWEVMRWGKAHGYRVFDLGGAGKPGVPYGVRDYKQKFGGEMVNFGRYSLVHRPALFRIAKTGFALWQKLR